MSASADAWASVRAEHATMARLIAENKTASERIDARLAELNKASADAWWRHSRFRGQLTRAERDGDPGKITYALARERKAYAEADATAAACLDEARALFRQGPENLSALLAQQDRVDAATTAWHQTWGTPATGRT